MTVVQCDPAWTALLGIILRGEDLYQFKNHFAGSFLFNLVGMIGNFTGSIEFTQLESNLDILPMCLNQTFF